MNPAIVEALLPVGTWVITGLIAVPVLKYALAFTIKRLDALEKKHDALVERVNKLEVDTIRDITALRAGCPLLEKRHNH
jgi:hypothetical protein